MVRQARQQAQQQRQLVEDARRLAGQQAAQAWETLRTARAQVESVRAQIRAQEIALDGVQREAVVGSRTTLDVLNAEQELLNARVSLVQALATLVNASYSLTATIGRLTAQDLALPVAARDACGGGRLQLHSLPECMSSVSESSGTALSPSNWWLTIMLRRMPACERAPGLTMKETLPPHGQRQCTPSWWKK